MGIDGKKVDVSINNGKISVGSNASPDLKRMAELVNKSRSPSALSGFMGVANNGTKAHFGIAEYAPKRDLYGLHQAHDQDGRVLVWEPNTGGTGKFLGDPDFLTKGKKGEAVGYKEATITIYEGQIRDDIRGLREEAKDPQLSVEEAMVSVFAHETDHDTNKGAIDAIQQRQEGGTNGFDVEAPALRVGAETAQEIKQNRPKKPEED